MPLQKISELEGQVSLSADWEVVNFPALSYRQVADLLRISFIKQDELRPKLGIADPPGYENEFNELSKKETKSSSKKAKGGKKAAEEKREGMQSEHRLRMRARMKNMRHGFFNTMYSAKEVNQLAAQCDLLLIREKGEDHFMIMRKERAFSLATLNDDSRESRLPRRPL